MAICSKTWEEIFAAISPSSASVMRPLCLAIVTAVISREYSKQIFSGFPEAKSVPSKVLWQSLISAYPIEAHLLTVAINLMIKRVARIFSDKTNVMAI